MELDFELRKEIRNAIVTLFQQTVQTEQIQPTRPEFEGSHTLVCFPIAKIAKKSPAETAQLLGEFLQTHSTLIDRYNVVNGFLNLTIKDSIWASILATIYTHDSYYRLPSLGKEMIVEYSSPNTNKPLHLGHLRNNFLGHAVAEIYKAIGYTVHKVQIINDRGIHICKSMAAWQLLGKGETALPAIKGDKVVGQYYVAFDRVYKKEVQELQEKGYAKEVAEKESPSMKLAIEMLQKWENKDPEIRKLWALLNSWVYLGFQDTYKRMGVDFDKLYYESDTYLLGKEEVLKGVEKGIFYKKEDGSIWVDLTADGLDQKVLLRSDGTSVYMTQDIGTAILRFCDFPNIEGQIYIVGNEQEYHFKVLFLILKKLGFSFAEKCYHLSYGMVDLPSGKMKSREGTVVDADDLMEQMVQEAEKQTRQLGKVDALSEPDIKALSEIVGLGALKFFLLKVDPQKRMLFDPNESIQLQGHTGPFIQYTHARIKSILYKATSMDITTRVEVLKSITLLEPIERELICRLDSYPTKLQEAAREYSPAVISNYAYELAKEYNQFYQSIPIFNEQDKAKLAFRIALSQVVGLTLKNTMKLLGIEVPEKM